MIVAPKVWVIPVLVGEGLVQATLFAELVRQIGKSG